MTKFQNVSGDDNQFVALPVEHFSLEANLDLSDYVLEISLSNSQKEVLWDSVQRSCNKPQATEVVFELCSDEEGSARIIEERALSNKRLKRIEKHLEHSRENTRSKFLQWAFGTFTTTLVISGLLTAFAVLNPEKDIDTQIIKDWTHLMITAEVGFISGAAGFYFARKNKSGE